VRASLLVVSLLVVPTLALAQESPPPPPPTEAVGSTVHRHLGFYFHVDIGPGYLTTSASHNGFSASASGASVLVSLAAGGAVAEDWILAGELWGAAAPSPTGASSSTTIGLSGVGLQVAHDFMPANLFFSLTPSVTVLSINNGSDTVGRTQVGFGAKLAFGKEWWAGDHWGLGLAAQGFFGVNKDQGTDAPTWSTFGGGLVFSATYN